MWKLTWNLPKSVKLLSKIVYLAHILDFKQDICALVPFQKWSFVRKYFVLKKPLAEAFSLFSCLTPETRVGPGGGDKMLALKKNHNGEREKEEKSQC